MHNLENMVGRRFGKLVIESRNPKTPKTFWNCLCDCGNVKVYRADHLKKYGESCKCDVCADEYVFEAFVEAANLKHANKYSYVSTVYSSTDTTITITCDEHGDFTTSPYRHLNGTGCHSCAKETSIASKQAEFIEQCKLVHACKYDYSEVVYTTLADKVVIICPDHGRFTQTAQTHRDGSGCKKCIDRDQRVSFNTFLEKATSVHSAKYSYDSVDSSFKNQQDKVEITCREHGNFLQSVANHVAGRGCPACARSVQSFDFVEKYTANPDMGSATGFIYLLEMFSEDERFLKVGITKNKRKRFELYNSQKGSYQYNLIYEKSMTNLHSAILEQKILSEAKEFKYFPLKKFTGRTECFSLDAEDLIINKLKEYLESFETEE